MLLQRVLDYMEQPNDGHGEKEAVAAHLYADIKAALLDGLDEPEEPDFGSHLDVYAEVYGEEEL